MCQSQFPLPTFLFCNMVIMFWTSRFVSIFTSLVIFRNYIFVKLFSWNPFISIHVAIIWKAFHNITWEKLRIPIRIVCRFHSSQNKKINPFGAHIDQHPSSSVVSLFRQRFFLSIRLCRKNGRRSFFYYRTVVKLNWKNITASLVWIIFLKQKMETNIIFITIDR